MSRMEKDKGRGMNLGFTAETKKPYMWLTVVGSMWHQAHFHIPLAMLEIVVC